MNTTIDFTPACSLETASSQSPTKFERAGVTFIYALCDPLTHEIRYIGKADDPEKRLVTHLHDNKHETNHKANWIRSLLAKGMKPVVKIVDEVSKTEWMPIESAYIIFYKEQGANLTNATLGGDGYGSGEDHPMFGKPRSREHCAKLSAARLGKKLSLEHRAKLSAAQRNRQPPSIETRAKLSAARKNRKLSDAARANMSAAQRKRKHSDATRAKIGASQRGKKHSAEAVAKVAAANRGKKRSEEVRAKIIEVWVKRRFQTPLSRRERRRLRVFLL